MQTFALSRSKLNPTGFGQGQYGSCLLAVRLKPSSTRRVALTSITLACYSNNSNGNDADGDLFADAIGGTGGALSAQGPVGQFGPTLAAPTWQAPPYAPGADLEFSPDAYWLIPGSAAWLVSGIVIPPQSMQKFELLDRFDVKRGRYIAPGQVVVVSMSSPPGFAWVEDLAWAEY